MKASFVSFFSWPRSWCYLWAYPSKEPGAAHHSVAWPLRYGAWRTALCLVWDMDSCKASFDVLPRHARRLGVPCQ